MEKTPKGTKPNTQHRHSKGRYNDYLLAVLAARDYNDDLDHAGTYATVRRVGDHFTLRINKEVTK